MTYKTNLLLDNIKKGIYINKNKEVDYIARIVIKPESNLPYEYAIIESGEEDNSFIPFTLAKGKINITHKNTDGTYKKKVLLLRSEDHVDVEVDIDVERYYNYHGELLETLGPRGQVLLNASAETATASTDVKPKKIWYKDPWVIGGGVLALFLIIVFVMATRKPKNSGSLFADL